MAEEDCRVGVVAIIRNQDNEFLMERRTVDAEEKKMWGFIAGGKKSGENVVQAAKREVREETGTEFAPDGIIGLVDHETQRDDNTSWTVVGLKGRIDREPENAEPEKRDRIEWKERIPENLHPTSQMMLEIYQSNALHEELDE